MKNDLVKHEKMRRGSVGDLSEFAVVDFCRFGNV